jgi:hypothetical protein
MSPQRAQVVGGVAGEAGEVGAQAGVRLGPTEAIDQVGAADPPSPGSLDGYEFRDRPTVDGDGDMLAGLHPP